LADIRGIDFNGNAPSGFSKAYRPVYLFYFNQTLFQRNEQVITLEDYTFDEQDYEQTEEESSICKICHIGDIVDDVNDLFICEHCNLGVHQLCEQPPIEEFEKEIDPWFCRQCSHNKGLPLKRKRSLQEENIQNKIKEFRQ
jgi:hypothetical protein